MLQKIDHSKMYSPYFTARNPPNYYISMTTDSKQSNREKLRLWRESYGNCKWKSIWTLFFYVETIYLLRLSIVALTLWLICFSENVWLYPTIVSRVAKLNVSNERFILLIMVESLNIQIVDEILFRKFYLEFGTKSVAEIRSTKWHFAMLTFSIELCECA